MTSNGSHQVDSAPSTEKGDGNSLIDDAVSRALEVINRDSALLPERYLSETTVPHGGE
jgi:hypothetical protein